MNKNIQSHLNSDEETTEEYLYTIQSLYYDENDDMFESHRYMDDRDRYGNDWERPDALLSFDGNTTKIREEPLNQMNKDWFDKHFPNESSRRKRYVQRAEYSWTGSNRYDRLYTDTKDSVNQIKISFFITCGSYHILKL